MAEVILFHHIHGLTPGVLSFAEALSRDGHTVHTPDLFDGNVFERMEDGFAHMRSLDPDEVRAQADAAVEGLPEAPVLVGMSWGVSQAQRIAQTRGGIRGVILLEACYPITGDDAFGPWPAGLRVQIHGMDQDEFFALEGDLDAARELVAIAGDEVAEVFTYSGDRHLFVDSSLPSYDRDASETALDRIRRFLSRL